VEVGAGLAGESHAALEFEWPGPEPPAELAGVGLAPETGHGGGIDVGGQGGGCTRGVVEGVDLGGDGIVLRP
jgi:hypothetical protein